VTHKIKDCFGDKQTYTEKCKNEFYPN